MDTVLRVLMIEDSEDDALLIRRELEKGGYNVIAERVETPSDMRQALSQHMWDIILADYQLPIFNAPAALKIVQENDCDIPFIIVSGTVGDDIAVEAMKAGAHDFFAKDRLVRLIPAVEREIRDAIDRRAHRIAEQELQTKARYDKLLREVAIQANIATSVEIVLQFAISAICQYTSFEVGHVFVAASDRSKEFASSGLWHFDDAERFSTFRSVTENNMFVANQGLLGDVVLSQHPLWISDLRNYTDFLRAKNMATVEFQTCVAFPVIVDTEVVAIFEFFSTQLLATDQPFLNITAQIAFQLSRVMEREQHLRALAASEERFRKLFEAVPIPLLITRNTDGVVLETNSVFVPLINDNIKSLIGTMGRNFLDSDEDLLNLQQEIEAQGELHEHELAVRRADGTRGWILLSLQNIEYQGEPARLSGFLDISERKRAEESERQQRKLAESLRDSAAVLLHSTLNIDSVLDHIFSQIQEAIPHDAATILLFDEDEVLRVAHTRAFRGYHFPPNIHGRAVNANIVNLRYMKMNGVPFVINDTVTVADWCPTLGVDWIRSNVGAPLRTADDTVGFITLESTQPTAFNDDHAQFLQAFANLAATAIQNARLYDELNRYANLLEKRVADRTEKLVQAKEYVETILNSTSDALVQIDTDGKIYQTNPAFDVTFNVGNTELYGELAFDIISPDDSDTFRNSIREVIRTGQSAQIEVVVQRYDGSTFAADVGIAPIKTEEQDSTRCICSFHDITRQKQIEEKLRLAAQEERTLRELKSRFISMATHEFRTPLAIIGMYTNLIRQQLHDHSSDHVANINEQLEYMENLMNEVLAIERADSSAVQMNYERFNLYSFIEQMVDDIQQSDLSDHQISYQASGEGYDVMMDKKIMRHILNNLVSNAIKYSPDSKQVFVDLVTTDDQVLLRVRDTGIGISKADLERLFEPFHRGQNVGDISGTGLGLAVIKRHIEMHGGTIAVESTEGRGTSFTVSLPRHGSVASTK